MPSCLDDNQGCVRLRKQNAPLSIAGNRVIFDLGGNKYRLVVRVSYKFRQVMIKFVGTHGEYDRIDPETV
jgi:mRNA-degrading endonuclease HigB of HigAB toxin-antitoxin module